MLSRTALVTLLAASVAASPIPPHTSQTSQCQGCGKAQTPGYDNTPRTIESGGLTRSFKIHVPENYNEHSSYPLIIDFGKSCVGRRHISHMRHQLIVFTVRYALQIVTLSPETDGSWLDLGYDAGPSRLHLDLLPTSCQLISCPTMNAH